MNQHSPMWQRARRPEQKMERQQAILDAAAELLDDGGLEATGLNAIARAADISKANIYRYFESREAILIALLQEELETWMDAFRRRLLRLAGKGDISAVARAFAETMVKQPRLCVLLAASPSVLEHNVSPELVIAYKRRIMEQVEPILAKLQAALPGLGPDRAYSFLLLQVMAACGFWPHCNPAPVVQEVLELPEFASLKMDFKRTIQHHATVLLRGLLD